MHIQSYSVQRPLDEARVIAHCFELSPSPQSESLGNLPGVAFRNPRAVARSLLSRRVPCLRHTRSQSETCRVQPCCCIESWAADEVSVRRETSDAGLSDGERAVKPDV